MATKYNSEGRVPANYPGLFNARENRMITHNYSVVSLVGENYEIKSDDGVTHLVIDASSSNVVVSLPAAALSKGRLLKVYVTDTTNDITIGGSSDYDDAGSYEIFCDGSSYFRVF